MIQACVLDLLGGLLYIQQSISSSAGPNVIFLSGTPIKGMSSRIFVLVYQPPGRRKKKHIFEVNVKNLG